MVVCDVTARNSVLSGIQIWADVWSVSWHLKSISREGIFRKSMGGI